MLLLGLTAAVAVLVMAGDGEQHAQRGAGRAQLGPLGSRTAHVVRPAPPARYGVPRRGTRVASGPGLRAALAARRPGTIVLAPGTYRGRRPFLNPHGHRLYSAQPGKAVLRAGLSLGGNTGPGGGSVQGVVVDVADPQRTVGGAAIAVWGTGRHSQILDTTVRGHSKLSAGVEARRTDGLRIERVAAQGFQDFGVLVDSNDPRNASSRERFVVKDVDISRVSRPDPGSSDGRAEACLWIGDPGTVMRARVRSCAWSGLWTGTAARGCRFSEIDVDGTRTGVYLEHFTHDSTFRRLRVGPDVRVGLAAEWADPDWGRKPASVGNVVEDSRFESRLAGVYLDEGTERTTIRSSTFANQRWAAIGDYRGSRNAYYDNDYGGIAPGAKAVSHEHLTSFRKG